MGLYLILFRHGTVTLLFKYVIVLFYVNIFVTVESATLRQSGLFKPSTYVEISVDDNGPRKTDISKNTTHPKWKEEVTVLVKPHTKILFRVIDHHNFRKDNVIGEKKLSLFQILQHFNGKCENLELTLGESFALFHRFYLKVIFQWFLIVLQISCLLDP